MTNERPASAVGNVMWSRRGVNVNVWLMGDENDVSRLQRTYAAVDAWLQMLPEDKREEVLVEPQRGYGGGGRGAGGGRADRFPPIEGYQCDKCGGPVGRKAKSGGMKTDAVVCLGSCQDPGRDGGRPFTHTVGWCNDDGTPGPKVPKSQQGGVAQSGTERGSSEVGGSNPPAPAQSRFENVGQLLTWARERGVQRDRVLELARAKQPQDINPADYSRIAEAIEKEPARA